VTKYIGITMDLARRGGEHLAQKGWQIEPMQGLQNLSRFDARAVEQVLIERFGLPNLHNQINSIATKNPLYQQAIQRGNEILDKIGFK
jgi:filamentous hemagglutinin